MCVDSVSTQPFLQQLCVRSSIAFYSHGGFLQQCGGHSVAKESADAQLDAPKPMHPLGRRTADEQHHFRTLLGQRGHNVVEPSFIPGGWSHLLLIESALVAGHCLASERPKGIGDTTILQLRKCSSAGELSHWVWTGGSSERRDGTGRNSSTESIVDRAQRVQPGYLRPGLKRNMGGGMWGRIMCLTGLPWKTCRSPDDPRLNRIPLTMVCNPERESQLWNIPAVVGTPGPVINPNRTLCLEAHLGPPADVSLEACDSARAGQSWTTSVAE